MESSKIIKKTAKRLFHLSKSLNFFEELQNIVIVLKNEKYKLFPIEWALNFWSILRRQKLMNLKIFKVHTTKNKVFSRILKRVHPQRVKKMKINSVKKIMSQLSQIKNCFLFQFEKIRALLSVFETHVRTPTKTRKNNFG